MSVGTFAIGCLFVLGLWVVAALLAGWPAPRQRVDYRRIHELEYELGFRDDPPPPEIRFGPGVIIEMDAVERDAERVAGMTEVLSPPHRQ